jgi:hypothetical protein
MCSGLPVLFSLNSETNGLLGESMGEEVTRDEIDEGGDESETVSVVPTPTPTAGVAAAGVVGLGVEVELVDFKGVMIGGTPSSPNR